MQRKIDTEFFLEFDLEPNDPIKKLQPVWETNRSLILQLAKDTFTATLENRLEAIFLIGAFAVPTDQEAKLVLMHIIDDPFEEPLILDAAQDAFDVMIQDEMN